MTTPKTSSNAQINPNSKVYSDIDLVQLQAVRRRISARDGMPITAEVWDEAHGFHLNMQQLHLRGGHRAGILMGLEVVATDPADTFVTIQPGAAIDAQGNLYVLTKPSPYNLGTTSEGWLRIILVQDSKGTPVRDTEGAVSSPGNNSSIRLVSPNETQGSVMMHVLHDRFDKKAVVGDVLEPHIEVARVRRGSGSSQRTFPAISDADVANKPQTNEIDMRFRVMVAPPPSPLVSVGVVHLGGPTPATRTSARGASALAHALTQSRRYQVVVDEEIAPALDLEGYTLVMALANAEPNKQEATALYDYVQKGGLVLADCPPSAMNALSLTFSGMGEGVVDVGRDHRLLHTPHLFTAPPAGPLGAGVQASTGVVLCAADYGRAWLGDRAAGLATREEIRTAHEFGENIIAYALTHVGERMLKKERAP